MFEPQGSAGTRNPTTIASSKTWPGSVTKLWTRCPRQAWSHSSLTIKTLPGSDGEPSLRITKSLYTYRWTSYPWTDQSVAWCAREYIWNEDDQSNRPQNTSHMHDWLGMIPEEAKTNFLEFTTATYIKCTWIKGSHSFHQTSTSWASMKKMLSKVSNTSLMFNKIMEEMKILSMGSTTGHPDFHEDGIP